MNKINKTPLISVVMPVYNASTFLSEAIESVVNQTYQNWELIIVDDGSCDNSLLISKAFAKQDTRIRVYKNKQNLGIGATMNRLLSLCKGEYIARMDSDDIMFPVRLARQLEFLQKHPHIGITGSFMVEIGSEKQMLGVRKVPSVHTQIVKGMYVSQTIQNPTLMMHRAAIDIKQLWFNPSLSPVDELDFFFRQISKGTQFANIPQYLMAYRRHNSNSSLKNIKKTFVITRNVREHAKRQYGYRPDMTQEFVNLVQDILFSIFPSQLIYKLFLFWKSRGHRINNSRLPIFHTQLHKKISLSLVMPIYKAEEFIRQNVELVYTYLKHLPIKFELITVVDGRADGSERILEEMAKDKPHLRVLGYFRNKGKGYAVKYGMSKARYEYTGFLDAGNDIDVHSLDTIIMELANHEYDAFIANKRHPLSICHNISWVRNLYSLSFRTLTNRLMGTKFSDTQVGLKLFKKDVLRRVLTQLPINIDGFAFDVELLCELQKNNYRWLSCPVLIKRNKTKSTVTAGHIFKMGFDITKLAFFYTQYNFRQAIKQTFSFGIAKKFINLL